MVRGRLKSCSVGPLQSCSGACVCVCVCVFGRDGGRETERERERETICVAAVYARARARARETVCVKQSVWLLCMHARARCLRKSVE